jgi:exonuclease III
MRLVTWNCYRGECLKRAGEVDSLRPDVIILQECGKPAVQNRKSVWFGDSDSQGVGIVARGEWSVVAGVVKRVPIDSVVAGDFNTHPGWDKAAKINHSSLVEYLLKEFGLVSAYHAAATRSGAMVEEATCYWQWKRTQPFHLDYCFIPTGWVDRLKEVTIGGYDAWADKSDHRPLLVDVNDQPSARPPGEE